MDFNHPHNSPKDALTTSEQDLHDLNLTTFAQGAAIEGTWKIIASSVDTPNWYVTIEKNVSNDLKYEPTLLDK